MKFNLRTAVNAYNNLSPSLLEGYVKGTELEETLKKYVQDVGQNGEDPNLVYGRTEGHWVELDESAAKRIIVRYGVTTNSEMSSVELNTLAKREVDPEGKTQVQVLIGDPDDPEKGYNIPEDGYMWICTNKPLTAWRAVLTPKWKVGADYTNTTEGTGPIEDADGEQFYCYRTKDELSENNSWVFVVDIDAAKKE